MKKFKTYFALTMICHFGNIAFGQGTDPSQKIFDMDLEALLNVKLTQIGLYDVPHTHYKGELMISYKVMRMEMEGNRTGTDPVSISEVHKTFMVSPTRMNMNMQMFGIMYAPSDFVTLMTMGVYLDKNMDHIMRSGMEFGTESHGVGDLKLLSLITLYEHSNSKIILKVGASLPTGSINKRSTTPMSMENEVKLPFPMQLGSGTVDPIIGATYIFSDRRVGFGFDFKSTVRFYDNKFDYHLGSQHKFSAWGGVVVNKSIALTLRSETVHEDRIHGMDADLNPMMVPTADPTLRGGTISTVGFGINFFPKFGQFDGLKLTIEKRHPVYQNLNGPQLQLAKHFAIHNNFHFAIVYLFSQLGNLN